MQRTVTGKQGYCQSRRQTLVMLGQDFPEKLRSELMWPAQPHPLCGVETQIWASWPQARQREGLNPSASSTHLSTSPIHLLTYPFVCWSTHLHMHPFTQISSHLPSIHLQVHTCIHLCPCRGHKGAPVLALSGHLCSLWVKAGLLSPIPSSSAAEVKPSQMRRLLPSPALSQLESRASWINSVHGRGQ